jgi:hypothetical protein
MKNKALEVQDKDAPTNDAHQKLLAGELKLPGNLFWANGANTTLDATSTGIIRVTSNQPNQDDPDASDLIAHLLANNSAIANPEIRNISRDQDNGLDPRPSVSGAAYMHPRADYPQGDNFFSPVNYIGAFDADGNAFWINDWTTLYRNNHLADILSSVKEVLDPSIEDSFRIYPNPTPAGAAVTIESDINKAYRVELYNINGILIRVYGDFSQEKEILDVSMMQNGMYLLKCVTEDHRVTAKILIIE